jgi:hypothetical protein
VSGDGETEAHEAGRADRATSPIERARTGDLAAWADLLPPNWLDRTGTSDTGGAAATDSTDGSRHGARGIGRLRATPVRVAAAVVAAGAIAVVLASSALSPARDGEPLKNPLGHVQPSAGPGFGPDASEPPIASASMAPSVSAGPSSAAGARTPAPPPSEQPIKATKPAKPDPPAPAPPPVSAVAGFRCPETASSGYTQHVGTSNWYLVTGGGWAGDGCQGHMIAMPMSGDPNRDDVNNVILWWFRVPSRPRCAVEVYVPGTQNVRDAAGAPATYFVYDTTGGNGSPIGQFGIDQVHNQGRWVAVGGFPATSGQLSVRLMSRGVSNIPGARLGGSAVRISC